MLHLMVLKNAISGAYLVVDRVGFAAAYEHNVYFVYEVIWEGVGFDSNEAHEACDVLMCLDYDLQRLIKRHVRDEN